MMMGTIGGRRGFAGRVDQFGCQVSGSVMACIRAVR
jgi:hypothetical protein